MELQEIFKALGFAGILGYVLVYGIKYYTKFYKEQMDIKDAIIKEERQKNTLLTNRSLDMVEMLIKQKGNG